MADVAVAGMDVIAVHFGDAPEMRILVVTMRLDFCRLTHAEPAEVGP